MTKETVDEPDEDQGHVSLTNWEFLQGAPTVEQVREMLLTLPDVWGVPYVDFIDYVQALPQKKKVKKPHPDRPGVLLDEYVDAYTLYMGVAGRIKMLERAAEKQGWRVDFVPEPTTPTGIPGYLNHSERLVYRVYVVIMAPVGPMISLARPDGLMLNPDGNAETRIEARKYKMLGRKPGTAWVPASGGSNAAGTNPYEKVETSALGRALAAWGFGVMPGSGIASVEEMEAIKGNRAYLEAESGAGATGRIPRRSNGNRKSRQTLLEEALALGEEVRQRTGRDPEEMKAKVGSYLAMDLGIDGVYDAVKGEVDWSKVKDGQLTLLGNSFRQTLTRLAEVENPI